jgi:hypothetical protein
VTTLPSCSLGRRYPVWRASSYLATITDSNGNFFTRSIITLHADHTMSAVEADSGGPNYYFSGEFGSWRPDGTGGAVGRALDFDFYGHTVYPNDCQCANDTSYSNPLVRFRDPLIRPSLPPSSTPSNTAEVAASALISPSLLRIRDPLHRDKVVSFKKSWHRSFVALTDLLSLFESKKRFHMNAGLWLRPELVFPLLGCIIAYTRAIGQSFLGCHQPRPPMAQSREGCRKPVTTSRSAAGPRP